MFKIIDIDRAETTPMPEGRGEIVRLVGKAVGAEKIDLHLNRLAPGGAAGKLHRHTISDNVYIVRRGEGRLQIENSSHTIREGQVVYIPAGVRHSLSNLSSEPLELFEIYAPAGASFDFIAD
jgi:mannose-6-phosphate isomerase-like protein (cupin superfamily)